MNSVGSAAVDVLRVAPQRLEIQPGGYEPGVCNIGPAEIAGRRRSGHIGLLATVVLYAILVLLDAPPLARFLVALPAAFAAGGYLQAALKFCVAFGVAGVFNFGRRGGSQAIDDREARARDRARVIQMMLMISAIALTVGVVAVLFPL